MVFLVDPSATAIPTQKQGCSKILSRNASNRCRSLSQAKWPFDTSPNEDHVRSSMTEMFVRSTWPVFISLNLNDI